jgi:hypothetical protein
LLDDEGYFRLEDLPSGDQNYSVAREGYVTLSGNVSVESGRPTRLDLTLLPTLAPRSGGTDEDGALRLDILFVIDTSRSMRDDRQQLTREISAFLEPLARDATVDLRIGVVRPDLGAGPYDFVDTCEESYEGALQRRARASDCSPPNDPWIALNGTETNIPSGAADPLQRTAEAFSCIAQLDSEGCGFEQPLEAMRIALGPKNEHNSGFLRPYAALAVVVVTDEDDCSAARTELFNTKNFDLGPANFRCFEYGTTCDGIDASTARSSGPRENCRPAGNWLFPLETYVAFLEQLKPAAVPVFFAVIAGPAHPVVVRASDGVAPSGGVGPDLAPSCVAELDGETSSAFPAIRLRAMVDHLAPFSFFGSICSEEYALTLRSLGEQIASTARGVCR